MQKFLLIQTAFIGDAILASGLIEKLHAQFPEAQIDFLVRKGNESLFAHHPFLHELLVWNKKQDKIKNLFLLLRKIRSRKYDKVINVQRFAATGLLTAFSGAGETIGFDKNPLSFLFKKRVPHIISSPEHPVHEVERNNRLIEHFTGESISGPRLYPSKEDYHSVQKFKTGLYICIAPASIWFTKQFPAEKWSSFISLLPANLNVYLLGGKEDMHLCNRLHEESGGDLIISLAGQLNLLQSAALMQDAVMNYVNDSAPMHLASAVNAPVTAVYCSTLPSFGFGPLSGQSRIVEIEEALACRPCGLHGYKTCPLGHFNCAWKINERRLLDPLKHLTQINHA